jgi:serine/threonine protein kinase
MTDAPFAFARMHRMAAPQDRSAFLDLLRRSGLLHADRLAELDADATLPADPQAVADELVRRDVLTPFQSRLLLAGRFRGLIVDRYRVLRPLGKGGMGLVYLAEHLSLTRRVALKILRSDLTGAPGVRERFAREGRAIAALNHPNIVRLYDVGQDGALHYLIMEYVEGRSLEELLQQKGRLPPREAVEYAIQAARGLAHAHERGIVHRDVKPANLLLDACGTVKILDMGLARFHTDSTDNLTERVGGGVLGSPDYLAPEQMTKQLDTRSDVYSLGATLYALLLGEPPFSGRTVAQKLADHLHRPVPPPHLRDPNVPRPLSLVVLRMLAKDPADRYQTPAEVIEALGPFAQPRPKPPKPPEPRPTEAVPEPARGISWRGAVLVLLAFGLLAGFGAVVVWAALRMTTSAW